jgi:hypothetical protein
MNLLADDIIGGEETLQLWVESIVLHQNGANRLDIMLK